MPQEKPLTEFNFKGKGEKPKQKPNSEQKQKKILRRRVYGGVN